MRENEKVRIISLGGFSRVTTNCFVYEYVKGGRVSDILLVDCGLGFPTDEMLGVDLLVPDVSYLSDKKELIRGIIISHGHEDHFGALPYILPQLGKKVPIYTARLTAGMVEAKLGEFGVNLQVEVVDSTKKLRLGPFEAEFARVTHSVPDAMHFLITTPAGRVYHGSDFKFDWTPVDGRLAEVGKIAEFGNRGITLALSDCLRVERQGSTPSERKIEETFEQEIVGTKGRFLVTTMSSNISRWQQAINVSLRHNRKIVLVGRSVEQNLQVAVKLGYVNLPKGAIVPLRRASKLPPRQLAFLIAGSQAQTGSSLQRAVLGEHDFVRVEPGDKVVMSTDYIPGNELAIGSLIDELSKQGVEVVYHEITDELHVSGHGSRNDLAWLVGLTRPATLLPIGGTWRHMRQYELLAEGMGYRKEQVLLPAVGQVVEVAGGKARLAEKVPVREVMVDGLGVGDVGNVVLRDRQALAEEGVVVAVVQIDQTSGRMVGEPMVMSRGVTFGKQKERLLAAATRGVAERVGREQSGNMRRVRQVMSDFLEKFFFKEMGRRPMVLGMVVEV